MVSPFPADPFGRCHCLPSRPPAATDPRLIASVELVESENSAAVHLTAALWGGDYRRTVPLSLGQAHELGLQLLALVGHSVSHGHGAGSLPLDVRPARVRAAGRPRGRSRVRPAQAVESRR